MKTSQHWQGICLILAAVFLFALQDAIGKYLFVSYPVPFVHTVRYAINLALLLAIFAPKMGPKLWQTQKLGLVATRGLSLAIGSFAGGLALRHMPLAEMVSILYLGPLLMLFIAKPVLGEEVKWFGWVATLVGFAGLLFIVRPGTGIIGIGLVFALLCLVTAVIYPVMSRLLSKTEDTATLMFYACLVGTVFFAVQLPWNLPTTLPNAFDWGLIIFIGINSLIAHFLFTIAYAKAPVSLLGPFTYAHIAWAAVLSWLVFDHVPDSYTFIGIGLVAIAGIANGVMNHLSARKVSMINEPLEI